MPIKRFPDDLDNPPGSAWPGWDYHRLEIAVDEYYRETERYEIIVRVQKMEGLTNLEVEVYDSEQDLAYASHTMYNDPKKLATHLEALKPQLDSESGLEKYIADFRKKYGKKPDSKKPDDKEPDGPGKQEPPEGTAPGGKKRKPSR